MLKSNLKEKISIVVDKELAQWIKTEAQKENRSVNNFLETLILNLKKEKEMTKCISMQ